MSTAQDIISGALRQVGTYAPEDTIEASHLDVGLSALNDLVSSLSTERLIVPYLTSENFPLVVGQSSYTIGSAGDFNTVRPMRIEEGAYIRDSSGNDYPVKAMSREDYRAISNKASGSRPTRLYYAPEYPLGKIYFDYEPSAIETLYIESWKQLTEFAELTTEVSLPAEYRKMLKFNLAVDLAPEFGKNPSQYTVMQAGLTKAALKKFNAPLVPDSKFDAGISSGGRFNILTGDTN